MTEIEQRHRGAHNELVATVWLMKQGYEVFRNVSSHGPIDIIARRGHETLLLDVKSASKGSRVRITQEQAELQIAVLIVDSDDHCEIDHDPPTIAGLYAPRLCPKCGCEFQSRDADQTYCGPKCRPSAYKPKKLKKSEIA